MPIGDISLGSVGPTPIQGFWATNTPESEEQVYLFINSSHQFIYILTALGQE